MSLRAAAVLAGALLMLAPATGQAALSAYSQNFEGLILSDPAALSDDGWLVYGNVFQPDKVTYVYGYGPFPAPNPGAGFCAIATGQGGAEQGAQQLSVYSDYNNQDHGLGRWIESNVYKEWTISIADTGLWVFAFDAKLGNLELLSTAKAFIKTLNPAQGYATTNQVSLDMTTIPATWSNYSLMFYVDKSLAGQLLQIGFANLATAFQGSGVFYDNLAFGHPQASGVPGPVAAALELRAPAPNPFTSATRIEFTAARAGDARVSIYDVTGRLVATPFAGRVAAGPHATFWDGRLAGGASAPAGVYRAVLTTPDGVRARNLVLTR